MIYYISFQLKTTLGVIPQQGTWLLKDQLGAISFRTSEIKDLVRKGIPQELRCKNFRRIYQTQGIMKFKKILMIMLIASLWQLWSGSIFKLQQSPGNYEDLLQYYKGQPSVATKEISKVKSRKFIEISLIKKYRICIEVYQIIHITKQKLELKV